MAKIAETTITTAEGTIIDAVAMVATMTNAAEGATAIAVAAIPTLDEGVRIGAAVTPIIANDVSTTIIVATIVGIIALPINAATS